MLIDPNDFLYAIFFAGTICFLLGMFTGAIITERSIAKELDRSVEK
jgi:hypothetical protein